MKKTAKWILSIIVLLIITCFAYVDPYNLVYSQHWKYSYTKSNAEIPWINFMWDGTSIQGKHYEKAAILLPVKIDGISASANFCCQFDLGAVHTMLYGNTLEPYLKYSEILKNKVGYRLWHECLKESSIQLGNMTLKSDRLLIYKGYGESLSRDSIFSNDWKAIGTIGIDICQNKILIIDYPNARICLLDSIPNQYKTAMSDMAVTHSGRAFLKMKHKGKEYDLFYDTGSSIFPLWVSKSMTADFSAYPVNDTVVGSRWGDLLTVYGRPMKDTVTIGGKVFHDFELFNNNCFESGLLTNLAIKALGFSGLTGNALFNSSIIILDFKSKKFGVI